MAPKALFFSVLLLLPLSARADSQTQFAEAMRTPYLPAVSDTTRAIALADLDGDGDLDLVCANFRAQSRVFRNDGRSFTDVTANWMPSCTCASVAVACGDVDGDKDVDVVLGNSYQQNSLYLNDATGRLVDVTTTHLPVDADDTQAVALGDVDGDGDLDLVIGNKESGQDRLYLNDGRGFFTDVTASSMPADSALAADLALGDVDGDRDLDIVVGNTAYHNPHGWKSGYEEVYLNDGAGRFTKSTTFPRIDDFTAAIALADLDGDGDLDLATANMNDRARLFLNDGKGLFVERSDLLAVGIDSWSSVASADVDRDNDVDLVLASTSRKWLFVNDGKARFTDATVSGMPGLVDGRLSSVALGDVNGDGWVDLAVGTGDGVNEVVLNDGAGAFPVRRRLGPVSETSVVVVGDVDADGDLDLVVAADKAPNRLFLNDGAGWFTDVTDRALPADSAASRCVALGDVDGDGDLDALFGNYAQKNLLYLNDGRGTFVDVSWTRLPPDAETTAAVALFDVDGDGDLDLVCANTNPSEPNRLYLNDGRGTFSDATATRLPDAPHTTMSIIGGDVDRDGDPDLLFGNGYMSDRLYLNDGLGTFTDVTATHLPPDLDWTAALALADLDRDGDLDLLCGNSMSGQNRYYRNDGTGRFSDVTLTHMSSLQASTKGLAVADVDEDGDLDVLVAVSAPERQDRLLVNDGNGKLTDATVSRMPVDATITQSVALADIDADGDVDAIWGHIGPNTITVNRHRHLFATDAPRLGDSYRLDFYGMTGYARATQWAVPFLGTSLARLPLPPLGVIGIDPSTAVALPAQSLDPPMGVAHLDLAIPSLAALLFLPLHSQALIVSDPAPARGWRLTNVQADQVRR